MSRSSSIALPVISNNNIDEIKKTLEDLLAGISAPTKLIFVDPSRKLSQTAYNKNEYLLSFDRQPYTKAALSSSSSSLSSLQIDPFLFND
jgi:hypothetical protein